MQEILLPHSLGEGRIDTIIQLFHIVKSNHSLKVDWSRVREITPAGWGILACLWDRVLEQKIKWKHSGLRSKLRQHPLLKRLWSLPARSAMPEPSFYNFEEEHAVLVGLSNTLLPSFMDQVEEWFGQVHGKLLDGDLAFSCRLILNELMVNAVDHSTAERYYLYAGFSKKQFQVGALDMGVTIPAKLERKYIRENDADYLKLALQEGSTTRRQQVGGLGLSHTLAQLRQAKGTLILLSRQAQLRHYFQSNKVRASLLKVPLDGTWCFANFPWKGRV